MFKLDLGKQRNQRSNSQHLLDHQKIKKFQKKYASALLTIKALAVWIIRKLENSSRDGNTRLPDQPPEKSVC